MDKDFMRSFYRKYYTNPQKKCVKESIQYLEKRKLKYEYEEKFLKYIKEAGSDLEQLFELYLDACADEQEILLEEMYLMGALDREKMLRGII